MTAGPLRVRVLKQCRPRLPSPTSTASPTARQDATESKSKRLEDPPPSQSESDLLSWQAQGERQSFASFSHDVFCVMRATLRATCYESCAQEVWHARRLSQEVCTAVAPEC